MHDIAALTTTTGFARKTVSALSVQKAEPEWMREKRLLAWRIFDEMPLPFWRRTDISGLRLGDLIAYHPPAVADGPFSGLPAHMRAARDECRWYAGLVLQRDSAVVYSALCNDLVAKGVIFTDLDTAVQKYPALVKDYMMTTGIAPGEDKFTALHSAFWSGGTLLYVPENVEVPLPFVSFTWQDTPGLALFSHMLIIARPGSRVKVLDEFASPPRDASQSLHSGAVEVFLGEGAEVSYADVQNWGPGVFSISHKQATLLADSTMHWIGAHLGSKLMRSRTNTTLRGPGATMTASGAYVALGRQHLEMDSLTDHVAPHTRGDILYRGIIRDRARTVFQGLIKVEKQAQQTDSYLANHNLLLSPRARADSIPTLEIEANDVRCTHGATVGQLDEEQLFYMRSRGLSRQEAERLIVTGFVQPIFDRIAEGGLRARVTAAVLAGLGVAE